MPTAPRPRPRTVRTALCAALLLLACAAPVPAQRVSGRPKPSPVAEKAGSAVAWRASFDAALAEAKQSGKPVFWYVATTPNSPMDRKDVVDLYARAGWFSMPEVVAFLNARTVPVKIDAPARRRRRTDAPEGDVAKIFERYGVQPGAFIEPGFVLVKPDGEACFKLDRVSTFHEGFTTALLRRELRKAGLEIPADEAARVADGAAPPLDRARRLLDLGEPERALAALETTAGAEKTAAALLRGAALSRLGRLDDARKALADATGPDADYERALLELRDENEAAAAGAFAKLVGGPRGDEAALRLGCALWRTGRHDEARAAWKALVAKSPASPAAWKAAAELEGFGPFARGFEEFGRLRDDAPLDAPVGTQRARGEADAAWLARRSVAYLLKNQGPHGGFEDSNYDFGGRDTLPDVYVAVTAIAARALLAWREVGGPKIEAAVVRALDYCADEKRCSAKNVQERMWAHAYRALLLRDALAVGVGDAAKNKAKLKEIVGLMEGEQGAKGAWAHEYPNPFVTALALHALHDARKAGAKIDPAKFDAGAEALESTRGKNGAFSYGFPGKGGELPFSAGRGPHAEFALKLAGRSNDERVAAAIASSFEHHAPYEGARKYDDHSSLHHGIGGFFYFYDEMHRADAILSLADPAQRREFLAKQREILLAIPEIDGAFVDSHELGKPYGTAAALLCLKATEPQKP